MLYVNDLPICLENSHAAMYADDTNQGAVKHENKKKQTRVTEGESLLWARVHCITFQTYLITIFLIKYNYFIFQKRKRLIFAKNN